MKSSCKPGSGNTYLTIGQDLFSINDYQISQYNYSLHQHRLKPMSSFAPSVAMVYSDLETLRGLVSPADYGSGVEYADGIINSIFAESSVGLQIGLWLNGTFGCEQIVAGEMDHQIRKLSNFLQMSNASAIFLRIGYEFDNPFFGYSDSPDTFIKAFQKIVRDLEHSLSLDALLRTQFVWHSWAAPRKENLTLEDFYPGNEFVDWVGISVFQQVFPWPSNWGNGFVDWGGGVGDAEEVLQFAQLKNKPTMIAESSPFGGINMKTSDTIKHNETDPWERWYAKVLDLILKYDIDMWSYINCDWDSQSMWRGVGFGDSRLSSNEAVMEKWQQIIIDGKGAQNFLMSGSLDHCGAKVKPVKFYMSKIEWGLHVPIMILAVALGVLQVYSYMAKRYREQDHDICHTSERTPLASNTA